MNDYSMTTFLTLAISIILLTIVSSNKNFSKRTRHGFIISFLLILIGTIIEFFGNIEGLGQSFYMFIILLKFSIVPIMPLICGTTIFDKTVIKENIELKIFTIIFIIYEFFIFYEYFSYKLRLFYKETYIIYVIIFIMSSCYMFFKAFKLNKFYQNANSLTLVLIILFIVTGIAIGIVKQNLQINWLIISISASFIYIYYNELIQCIDGLTLLLNQKSFNNYIENIHKKSCIIIFDINDFKLINDTYGHKVGDEILCVVSSILKEVYRNYGKCYRIGGDEFAVIATDDIQHIEKYNKKFITEIIEKKKEFAEFPYIAYGVAEYNPKENNQNEIMDVIKKADEEMYKYKNEFKDSIKAK